MPATMTHQLFAKEIIELVKTTFPLLKKKEHLLMLATQGPDPFFFYQTLPWQHAKDAHKVRGIGSYLHHHKPAKQLKKLYDIAKSMDDEDVYAYMIGAIMHYILDKHVHPYVFSRSGFASNGMLTPPFNIYHSHMETLIDVALIQKKKVPAVSVHPARNIHLPKHTLKKIDTLYLKAYPDIVSEDDFLHAATDMHKVYSFLYDRFGIKRNLLRLFFGKASQAFASSHPKTLRSFENKDVLNVSHISWRHTETGDSSNEDVLQLFERAKEDMLHILSMIKEDHIDFEAWTQDINYDGLTSQGKHTYQTMMFPLWRVSQ